MIFLCFSKDGWQVDKNSAQKSTPGSRSFRLLSLSWYYYLCLFPLLSFAQFDGQFSSIQQRRLAAGQELGVQDQRLETEAQHATDQQD